MREHNKHMAKAILVTAHLKTVYSSQLRAHSWNIMKSKRVETKVPANTLRKGAG